MYFSSISISSTLQDHLDYHHRGIPANTR